ncbi:helicase-like transcription factor CHR28 [Neltuma alba]|uniref:helicase-like transcription factor CHR28 n=1 Tax=Neltuma alba TaxID=207710 RepID=UPI0010A366F2|nr:helicase-like transcription factor CHR28 [Prosopis alba]XP_028767011.1 helicase-like transcription factor CHR28 [Prosopis alba]XP_028767012.1 helicase-like transcription factor CHR28 [Prosopis alba]XP_028767013.1 helicase-like transcription factor CHR28 [Prosopis alba]XP_028767014.1 helicase-like transcription factor CHR28 [Prosopis alba]XP_028767015.1 helicase-like transcription factor CHR28 [Prosopis alba]
MAQMECIYISSSDDDLDLEEIQNPNYGNRSGWPARESNSGYGGGLTLDSSSRWANTSNASSSGAYNHSPSERYTEPVSSGYMPNRRVAYGDGSFNVSENGNTSQFQTINSRIAKSSGADYEKIPSQQALKRTLLSSPLPAATKPLPSSLQSFAPGSSMISEQSTLRDSYGRGNDERVMYQNGGIRILPPPMIHGKSISNTQLASSSEAVYRSGPGEERASENDERLIYQAALEDLNQPKFEANLPDGLMSVSLLRHQKIALAWMLQKETRSLHCLGGILADDQGLGKTISMIALIQMQRSLQSKSKADETSNHKAEALNLDEEEENDDAGGTVEKSKNNEEDDIKPMPESVSSSSTRVVSRKRPAAGTLVVCPASVLRQWARELDDKVGDEAKLSVLIYHGGNRTKDPVELAKYDVVLTTYSIVTNEVPKQPLVEEDEVDEKMGEKFGLSSDFAFGKKRKKAYNANKKSKKGKKGIDSSFDSASGALAKVGWFRVILDEAQTIKNHRTQVARACCSLRAKRRWCLSGTPIQNAIEDLYSYFRFLKYDPYAAYKSFYNTIKVPISKNSIQGYKKLQAVLRAIMLRRTKGTLIDGQPIITLPPKTVNLNKVDFSIEERDFYTKLEAESRSQFKAYAAAGTVNQNYANILLMLLRLRQACDHPLLVKDYSSDFVGENSIEMARTLPREMLVNLFNCLEASFAICKVCNDTPDDPVVTMCGHVFCYQCVSEHLTGYENMCPAADCKEQIGDDVVFSKATLRSCISGDHRDNGSSDSRLDYSVVLQSNYGSSKIKALLEILELHLSCSGRSRNSLPSETSDTEDFDSDVIVTKHTRKCSESTTDGPMKAIVFSQWTSMLDLVEDSLKDSGIRYRRLDGTMTLVARDKSVKDFNTNPEVTVLLMSLKAGNLGLNLVAACHVILLDLWWNPTTEDQAVDRAHRIGQTRPVTVTRLTIKDTVEDRILALQEDKRKMVASAFGEDQAGGTATRLTVDDLKYLFMV